MALPPVLVGLVIGLVVSQVAMVATTVYLHRGLSHRALTLTPRLTVAFRVVTWITTGIRPRQWVAVHRKHHAHTDAPGDPHSPVVEGFAKVQLGNVALYRRVARDEAQVARYARDIRADIWDRLLFDHALVGLGIGIALLALVCGPLVAVIAAVVHVVAYLMLNAAVNAVGHTWGRRPYDNTACNSQLLALMTVGEGLHNNHHHRATSARLAMAKGQIDPGWWFIRAAQRRGWLTVREPTPDLVAI